MDISRKLSFLETITVIEIVRENRFAALSAGVLAAMLKGAAGSAAGGALGGLVSNMLDWGAGGVYEEQDTIDRYDDQ